MCESVKDVRIRDRMENKHSRMFLKAAFVFTHDPTREGKGGKERDGRGRDKMKESHMHFCF